MLASNAPPGRPGRLVRGNGLDEHVAPRAWPPPGAALFDNLPLLFRRRGPSDRLARTVRRLTSAGRRGVGYLVCSTVAKRPDVFESDIMDTVSKPFKVVPKKPEGIK
ncbi:hypothetical protein [Nonomuraea rubra]|uniref:hypothetical protein n=1 Tax=Nonomuraea rubra TaxID=46180 RepID=UPI0031E69270